MSEPSSFIKFLSISSLDESIIFNPGRTTPLTFQCDDPPIKVSIRSESREGRGFPGIYDLVCRLECEIPVDSNLASFVEGLEREVYVPVPGAPLSVPLELKGKTLIDAEGKIQAGIELFMEHCPPPLEELCNRVLQMLMDQQNRFLRLLRWRQNIDAPHFATAWEPALYFCVTGPSYIITPRRRGAPLTGYSPMGIRWSTNHEDALRNLWVQETLVEPVAHEILREAMYLQESSPRSCLAMTATALEIGVKDHVGRAKPDTAWLLSKMPSPPVYRILRELLPVIHQGNPIISDWSKLKPFWNTCQKIAEDRNSLVHAGVAPSPAMLTGYLFATNDVLYLLDILNGQEWARDFVSDELRASQGWPEPLERKNFISVSAPISFLEMDQYFPDSD